MHKRASMEVVEASDALSSLPTELLALVAEELDAPCLGRFAAACAACLAAAQSELRAALLEMVLLCLEPGEGPFSNALVASPHFFLPDDLVDLPEGAFYGNTALTELMLPAGVTTMPANACCGCSNLVKLALPAALNTIGDEALAECSSLTELTLPAALTSLGSNSLLGASSLRELTLPAALSTIGCGCFMSCSALVEITLPDALTSLAGATFKCNYHIEHRGPRAVASRADP